MTSPIEVLMITHNRPEYTRRSLPQLLATCSDDARVWVWHNGHHEETIEIVRSFQADPKLAELRISPENVGIREPMNWFWEQSTAPLVGKVDDDCLVPPGWIETLASAHGDNSHFGSIACWHFREEDYDPDLAAPKLRDFAGGHRLLVNFWTPGSGYLMKRTCIDQAGLLKSGQSFTEYCIDLALSGWVNGWYFPFVVQDHMDDPRSEFTLLRSDDDIRRSPPLSAKVNRTRTLEQWDDQLRRSARLVQSASIDPLHYQGVHSWLPRLRRRIRRTITGRSW